MPAAALANPGPEPPCAGSSQPRTYRLTLPSGGTERSAVVHVPALGGGRRSPLLIALHGAGQNGQFFERYTGFSTIADGEGFTVVYPDAAGERPFWSINDSTRGAPDDVRFISDLLDRLQGTLCIDASRVYATGVSNGGGMAARLGCQLSLRLAAIAPVAGGYRSLPPCQPEHALSVLEVHGTSDPTVPYGGHPPDQAGAVPQYLAQWAGRDGCRGKPRHRRLAAQVIRLEWSPCGGRVTVAHLEIAGGTHQLPGGLPPDRGPRSAISAPWEIWRFLRTRVRTSVPARNPRRAPTPGPSPKVPPPDSPPADQPPGSSMPGGTAAPRGSAAKAGSGSPQCAAPPQAGSRTVDFTVDGHELSVVVHVPPGVGAGSHLPLLVALHGYRSDGRAMERLTGFSALADHARFVVAYPSAPGGRWALEGGEPRARLDLDFVRVTVDRLSSMFCIDRRRRFLMGVSNGAGEAARVGCELAGQLAGMALLAGDYRSLTACAPPRPLSVLEIHGTRDTVVPYHGRRRDHAGSVPAFLALVRRVDRCHPRGSRRRVAVRTVRQVWRCAGNTRVSHLKLIGVGHVWPGTPPPGELPGPGSGADAIWQFFAGLAQRGRY